MQPATTLMRSFTVMFVDIEGFTALTAQGSRDSVVDLIRRARELVQPQVARHRGRIVKTLGDGFLILFDSPTEAVLAGRDIQREAVRRNRAFDREQDQLRFRIGITTGEVQLEDNDVYGDPVNLASRIQQIAPAGEVYFSEATYQAMTRSEVEHESAGDHELKGVADKVKVYHVVESALDAAQR